MKKEMAYLLLRVSLGLVFLAFGIGKFQNDSWALTIRNMDFFLKLPWSVNLSLFLIGLFEIITGLALIAGLFTRIFAAMAAVQLAGILILLKFAETRDIALLGAAVFLATQGTDSLGIGSFLKRKGMRK